MSETDNLYAAIEALLFVSDDPVAPSSLAGICEVEPGDVAETLAQIQADYQDRNCGIQLREVAGGWRFYTHPAYHELIEKYILSWDTRKLSQASLEALAVIAYHQPVTRQGVNAIRGVSSEAVISSLVEKGLVREVGHDSGPGNAILYGTTRTFLEKFGLKSIADLPDLEQFAPDEESKKFIRERLSAGSLSSALDTEEELEDEIPDDTEETEEGAPADTEGRVSEMSTDTDETPGPVMTANLDTEASDGASADEEDGADALGAGLDDGEES